MSAHVRSGRWGLRGQLCRVASVLCVLAALEGCGTNNGGQGTTPDDGDWFAYFRLTQDDEAHLYIREGWEYALVPDASADGTFLTSERRRTIEELFSSGLEKYESDSISTSGADMGECDPTEAHPIVHAIVIHGDPPVGKPGFGCWSTNEDISEATRTMIERMEEMLQSLTREDAGM